MLKKSMTALLTTAAVTAAVVGTLAQQPPAPAGRQGAPGGWSRWCAAAWGVFTRAAAPVSKNGPQEFEQSGTRYRVVPFVQGWRTRGAWRFSRRRPARHRPPGRLRIVRNGTLDPQPVAGVPAVWATGQGGLLEVLPHPKFVENR